MFELNKTETKEALEIASELRQPEIKNHVPPYSYLLSIATGQIKDENVRQRHNPALKKSNYTATHNIVEKGVEYYFDREVSKTGGSFLLLEKRSVRFQAHGHEYFACAIRGLESEQTLYQLYIDRGNILLTLGSDKLDGYSDYTVDPPIIMNPNDFGPNEELLKEILLSIPYLNEE